MIDEVRALRAEIKAGNYQLAKNTGEMGRAMMFLKWVNVILTALLWIVGGYVATHFVIKFW